MFCISLHSTNGRYTHNVQQQLPPAFYSHVRNTSNHNRRHLSTYRCIDVHAFQEFLISDSSHKIQEIAQSKRGLSLLEACDRDCKASVRICIYFDKWIKKKLLETLKKFRFVNLFTYRFCFFWFCPLLCTELISRTLFEFPGTFLFLLLFLVNAFSLLFLRLLLTWTLDAPSKRSFSESPITLKFGNRIQQVLTEQEPDIPWHLHSSRISAWTCWKIV